MFVVVRHAHAVGKATWRGAETNRPLSPLGRRQASGLVAALDGIELHTLFSSPTARCRDTLGALAADRVLPVQDHWLLAPDA
ncbi:histidine phosphatase family protein, partial [Rhodococcus koreensis]